MKQNKQKLGTFEIKVQQDFITKKKQKQKKVLTRNIPKINDEQTKGNAKFYFYLYPFDT